MGTVLGSSDCYRLQLGQRGGRKHLERGRLGGPCRQWRLGTRCRRFDVWQRAQRHQQLRDWWRPGERRCRRQRRKLQCRRRQCRRRQHRRQRRNLQRGRQRRARRGGSCRSRRFERGGRWLDVSWLVLGGRCRESESRIAPTSTSPKRRSPKVASGSTWGSIGRSSRPVAATPTARSRSRTSSSTTTPTRTSPAFRRTTR